MEKYKSSLMIITGFGFLIGLFYHIVYIGYFDAFAVPTSLYGSVLIGNPIIISVHVIINILISIFISAVIQKNFSKNIISISRQSTHWKIVVNNLKFSLIISSLFIISFALTPLISEMGKYHFLTTIKGMVLYIFVYTLAYQLLFLLNLLFNASTQLLVYGILFVSEYMFYIHSLKDVQLIRYNYFLPFNYFHQVLSNSLNHFFACGMFIVSFLIMGLLIINTKLIAHYDYY